MNSSYPATRAGRRRSARSRRREQVVTPADVVVDLHGGDLDENLRPYSYWFRSGRTRRRTPRRGAELAFGLDHIIVTNVESRARRRGAIAVRVRARRAARRCSSPRRDAAASLRRRRRERARGRVARTCSARSKHDRPRCVPVRRHRLAGRRGRAVGRGQRRCLHRRQSIATRE